MFSLCDDCRFNIDKECPIHKQLEKEVESTEEVKDFFEDFENLPEIMCVITVCDSHTTK